MKTAKLLVLALAGLSLSGCALFGNSADRALRKTPSFKAGYADGCAAATNVDSDYRHQVAPDPAYKGDKVYHSGWTNGFQTCRRTDSNPGSLPGNPIQDPSPGY